MKNSFTLNTEECTCLTDVSAEALLAAECFVYFRVELWMRKAPGGERTLLGGGWTARALRSCTPFSSEAQSASKYF